MVTIKVAVGFIPGKSKFGMLCWINALTITLAIYRQRIAHIIERFEQKFSCFIFCSRHVNAAITLWCHFAKNEKKYFFQFRASPIHLKGVPELSVLKFKTHSVNLMSGHGGCGRWY